MSDKIANLVRAIRLYLKIKEPVQASLNWQTILAIYSIWIPIIAMMYWWVFFMNFHSDYFAIAYNLDDIFLILFKKSVKFGFAILINLFIAWIFLFRNTLREIRRIIMILIGISIMCGVAKSESFSYSYLAVLLGLTTAVTIIFILYDKGAIYGYSLVFGLFLFLSAKTDAQHAHHNIGKYSIISDRGEVILDKNDENRYYVGYTSQYIMVFDKEKSILEKYDKRRLR